MVQQWASFELLVVDNTGDGSAEWALERSPEVLVAFSPQPRSFAANVNVALRTLASGRYFVLLNPDIICFPGLLDEAVQFMDANPQRGHHGTAVAESRWHCAGILPLVFNPSVDFGARALRLDGLLEDPADAPLLDGRL